MIRARSAAALCVATLGVIAGAKTPQQLRTEIAALLPAGQKARMIWSEKPSSSEFWTVYGCDSDDGVIRELTPASLFAGGRRSIPNALLSRDGRQVVLKENLSGTVYVMDWNGQNFRTLIAYARIGHTWQDPSTAAQYVMLSDLEQAGTWLVNLNNPQDRRKIWNDNLYDEETGGTDGVGISLDGARIGAFLCERADRWSPGVAATPSGAPVCGECGGCNFAMRPVAGTAYEYSHFPNGHSEVCVHNADGSVKGLVDMASTVEQWAERNYPIAWGEEPALLTWTNNPDYVTYQIGSWRVNPILFCVTSKRWVGMRDDLTGAVVNRFSVVFMPASGALVPETCGQGRAGANRGARPDAPGAYTVSGKQIKRQAAERKPSVVTVP